jgi:hypothetical protein
MKTLYIERIQLKQCNYKSNQLNQLKSKIMSTKQTLGSKPTLLEAIMIYLKGGDEKKVLKFTQRLEKYYKSQIAIRQSTIDGLNDQLSDAEEALVDLKVNINMESISSATGLDSYCASYVQALHLQRKKIVALQNSIKEEEEGIQILEDLKSFNLES